MSFMEQTTYEQYEISKEDMGDNANYITPDDDVEVEVTFYEGKPVGIELPIAVERVITYCEPGVKGDTSGKTTKPATLDTGFVVNVPLFCDIGTKIKLDTRDGTFIERCEQIGLRPIYLFVGVSLSETPGMQMAPSLAPAYW